MIATLNEETRPVTRQRRGVLWCPFCDRSRQDEGLEQWCDGCHAKFEDDALEPSQPTPRRRRRSAAVEEDEPTDPDVLSV